RGQSHSIVTNPLVTGPEMMSTLAASRGDSVGSGVVGGAVPVNDHCWLVAYHPRVVTAGQRCHVPRLGDELTAVVHPYREPSADVVLEVRRLARVGTRDGLDVVGPAPARLEHQPADFGDTYRDELDSTVRKLPHVRWSTEAHALRLLPQM